MNRGRMHRFRPCIECWAHSERGVFQKRDILGEVVFSCLLDIDQEQPWRKPFRASHVGF